MKREKIIAVLQALAVGDSFGKTTEFASRRQICSHFTEIHDLLIPEQALAHADMKYGTVTDDTEQNLFLLDQFCTMKEVSPGTAAQGLIRWYEESAEPQKYIGPSSAKALDALRHGVSWEQTGRTGTTCGGVMRTPAAFLCGGTLSDLTETIRATLLPTHNTFQAMEAALAYGYALWGMSQTRDIHQLLDWALRGCQCAEDMYPEEANRLCAPRCAERLKYLYQIWENFHTQEQLLDFLFNIFGTTVSSCDVMVAAFALFLWAKDDVMQSIEMAAMLGGDTDTIGCLAAVLCCVYADGHNIPRKIIDTVCGKLDLEKTASQVEYIRKGWKA